MPLDDGWPTVPPGVDLDDLDPELVAAAWDAWVDADDAWVDADEKPCRHDYRSNSPILIGADGQDIRLGPAVCCLCGHIAVDVPARRLT